MSLSLIKKSFNKAAASYDDACELQLQTGRHLIHLLKSLNPHSETMLDAGCGTGIITKKLATEFDFKKLYAIDIADTLIGLAKEKMSEKNIVIEHADFNQLSHIDVLFDIIYANLALHWSFDIAKTLHYLKTKLSDRGLLCFTIPLSGTFFEIEDYCSIKTFFEKDTINKLLESLGFNVLVHEHQHFTFHFKSFIEALKSIKIVGTNHVAQRKSDAFKKIRLAYSIKKPFQLTYHIGYFICQ